MQSRKAHSEARAPPRAPKATAGAHSFQKVCGDREMPLETARALWKAAAVAVFIAILVFIATQDSGYTWLSFGVVFVGFGIYEMMQTQKPGK